MPTPADGPPPRHRVVVLGASNVTISLRRIVGLVRAGFDGEIDLFVAHGHGRSYGSTSRIPGRSLPAITRCRLWDDVERAPEPTAGTQVLVTDVGNDLIYGTKPEPLLRWVETCLSRLVLDGAEAVVVRLPISRMHDLSEAFYRLFVGLCFPSCRVTFAQLRERALAVDAGLVSLADRFGVPSVEPPRDWYGLDPIHVRASRRSQAWRAVVSHWPSVALPPSGRPRPVFSEWSWLSQRPAERTLLGQRQRSPQPTLQNDGVRLHVY